MNKSSDVKVMLKEAAILLGITLIAGLLLGFVYELTKPVIAEREADSIKKACAVVFTDADHFNDISYVADEALTAELGATNVKPGTVYEAVDASGSLLGYVIESTSTKGYGGSIVIYTGIRLDGTVNDISILKISETAGLGMNADSVLRPQFHDKKVELFTYTKNGSTADSEIDAISGATITTKAVTNAVNGALTIFKNLTGGVQ